MSGVSGIVNKGYTSISNMARENKFGDNILAL